MVDRRVIFREYQETVGTSSGPLVGEIVMTIEPPDSELLLVARFLFVQLHPTIRESHDLIRRRQQELLRLYLPAKAWLRDPKKIAQVILASGPPDLLYTARFLFVFLHPEVIEAQKTIYETQQDLFHNFPEHLPPVALLKALEKNPKAFEQAKSLREQHEAIGLLIEKLRWGFASQTNTLLNDQEDKILLEMYPF